MVFKNHTHPSSWQFSQSCCTKASHQSFRLSHQDFLTSCKNKVLVSFPPPPPPSISVCSFAQKVAKFCATERHCLGNIPFCTGIAMIPCSLVHLLQENKNDHETSEKFHMMSGKEKYHTEKCLREEKIILP